MRRAGLFVGLLAAVLLTGCAAPGIRGQLHYGLGDAPEGQQLLWPAAPEVPRFLYTGTLIGEPNFRKPEADDGALSRLLQLARTIAGVDATAELPLVMQRPSSVVGDDQGRLYVSDAGRSAIWVFDERAGELQLWSGAAGGTGFRSPAGLATAPGGGVFVADADAAVVLRLDAQGGVVGEIGRGLLRRPTGLARDAVRGHLYVADTTTHDIKVFDDLGRLLHVIGRRGSGDGEFNFPTHLAFAQGELYVTDTLNHRIQVFAADGQRLARRFGERGLYLGNLVRPKGVAVDSEGNVYVVESYYDSLLVFSARGDFLMPIGGTGTATGRFYLPAGVWVDGRNRVHVADMFNGRVVLFQFLGGG
ncbi:MAG TPA: 6-bladed beta-propeller [Rubrivivax sp.]|nr:6-bladed beta-propeller [Rubrivivax sp.]